MGTLQFGFFFLTRYNIYQMLSEGEISDNQTQARKDGEEPDQQITIQNFTMINNLQNAYVIDLSISSSDIVMLT